MITKRFKQTLASLVVVNLLVAPAFAWEFGMSGDQVFWTGVRDDQGRSQLVFFCSQASPGVVQLQVFTDEPGPSEPVAVELLIGTTTGSYGPIRMRARSQDGNLTIATTGPDVAAMNAAQSIYAEVGTVTLSYYESTWRYPGAGYSDAFGAMLDACG